MHYKTSMTSTCLIYNIITLSNQKKKESEELLLHYHREGKTNWKENQNFKFLSVRFRGTTYMEKEINNPRKLS